MVKENQLDLILNKEKKLNINLYEIRLEDTIINNNRILDAFFLDCRCVLFMVDTTNNDDLEPIKTIISYMDKDKDKYSDIKKFIVENKIDINKEPNNNIKDFIDNNPHIEQIILSIKNGTNLNELLSKIYEVINSKEKKLIPINHVLKTKYTVKMKEKLDKECIPIFSIILLGNSGVGKTNFMTRYANNTFKQIFLSTTGFNMETKLLMINSNFVYRLTLLDTAGQERFKSLPKKYYRDADAVLLLFDVNNRESFNEVNNWVNQIKEYSEKYEEHDEDDVDDDNIDNDNKKNDNVVIYLLGNKIDITKDYDWAITSEEIDDLVENLHVKYYDICCKWNLNVEEIMARIVYDCHKRNKGKIRNNIKLNKKQQPKKKKIECCV